MIYSLSRYTYGVNDLDKGVLTASRKATTTVSVFQYTVRPGDTFENLAAKLYGDSAQYWRLADLNPQIKFPLDLKAGDVIRIPQ